MIRFSLAVAVALVGFTSSGLAQQHGTFKVKPSASEKAPKKAAPIGKTPGAATASAANAKDLQNVEHENTKASPASRPSGKKQGTALKPIKDKPNPPINFNGASGKSQAGTHPAPDPSKGRLKQKHSHQ